MSSSARGLPQSHLKDNGSQGAAGQQGQTGSHGGSPLLGQAVEGPSPGPASHRQGPAAGAQLAGGDVVSHDVALALPAVVAPVPAHCMGVIAALSPPCRLSPACWVVCGQPQCHPAAAFRLF